MNWESHIARKISAEIKGSPKQTIIIDKYACNAVNTFKLSQINGKLIYH